MRFISFRSLKKSKKIQCLIEMEFLNLLWLIPSGYLLFSSVLFIFPSIIHKKKKSHFEAFHISHRGGSGQAVENTLGAFKNALKCGAEMLELDVRLTKDGKVVVFHDPDFSRTADFHDFVKNTNYRDFPSYKENISLVFSKKKVVLKKELQKDKTIPLLSDVFDAFPNIPINIDIKIENDELIDKVSDLIKEKKREKITVWGSFKESTTKKCYQKNTEIPLFCSLSRVIKLTLSFYSGLLPFMSIKEDFIEIPLLSADTIKSLIPPGLFTRFIVSSAHFLLMNRLFFWHLKRRGIKIFVWVLNEENEFEEAMYWNVDGIMSDYPSKLSMFLSQKNQCDEKAFETEVPSGFLGSRGDQLREKNYNKEDARLIERRTSTNNH